MSHPTPPASALTIWHDGQSLFVLLPGPDNSPPIPVRYPLTIPGLQSALGLIRLAPPRTTTPPAIDAASSTTRAARNKLAALGIRLP